MPGCGKPLSPLGFGTEKVEQEVRQTFLQASVSRMDSDTMSGRGRHEEVLSAFASGQSQVLIGTQMIAKGLDFPNVLLVGVICADSALFLPDYRAAERTFQLLSQVIGRTGRGPKGGRVVVQAYNPRHFAIQAGVGQDYAKFARTELAQRKEAHYPPYLRLIRVVVHAPTIKAGEERTAALAADLRAAPDLDAITILGPAPAPITRLNDQWRFHLICKCPTDTDVEATLARLSPHAAGSSKVRVLIDVDPLTMM
jgi:primosomal protein N' (replication factor Y)